jgi:hypothetical protein
MAGLEFSVPAIAVACTDAAKTVLGVKAPTNQAVEILGIYAGFAGVTSSEGPALIELCQCTFATNGPGTNSTSVTPAKTDWARTETIQSTAAKNWSSEPTVVTFIEPIPVPVYMGFGMTYFPLNSIITIPGGGGFVLRITLPSTVTANFTGSLRCKE